MGISPDDMAVLLTIRRNDPDGKPTEPTEEDYAAFEAWVIQTFGKAMWDRYQGNWEPM